MSTLNNTDVFAVTRGTSTYKVSFADIAAGVPLPPALVYKGSWAPTATAPVPAGGLKAGMVYVMTPAGTLSASWVGIGGRHADDGQLAIWEGAKWELVGNTGAIPDATATVKGVVQLADAAAVTAGTPARVVDAAELKSGLASKADLASPALTGTPTAPTAAAGTNTTQLATTAFVHAAVAEEDFWDRTGTELHPKTAGDAVFTSGAVKVGGTTAAPNITLGANGLVTLGGAAAGLKFPATAAKSTDPNTLDDYETGAFTPNVQYPGGTPITSWATVGGVYTIIGDWWSAVVTLNHYATGIPTGDYRMWIAPPIAAKIDAVTACVLNDETAYWGGTIDPSSIGIYETGGGRQAKLTFKAINKPQVLIVTMIGTI